LEVKLFRLIGSSDDGVTPVNDADDHRVCAISNDFAIPAKSRVVELIAAHNGGEIEEALRFRHRQGSQQDGVNQAECGGSGADCQRIDPRQDSLIAVCILQRFDGAELQPGLAVRLGRGQSGADLFLRQQREMLLELLFQSPLVLLPGEQSMEPRKKPSERPHRRSAAFTVKKRRIIAAVCSH